MVKCLLKYIQMVRCLHSDLSIETLLSGSRSLVRFVRWTIQNACKKAKLLRFFIRSSFNFKKFSFLSLFPGGSCSDFCEYFVF